MSLAKIRLNKAKSATEHLFEALHDEEVADRMAADWERTNQLLALLTHANRLVDEMIIDEQFQAAGVQRSGATDGAPRGASTSERSEGGGKDRSRSEAGKKGSAKAFFIHGGTFDGFHRARKVRCEGCGTRLQVFDAAQQGWNFPDLCPGCEKKTEPEVEAPSVVRRSPPLVDEPPPWKHIAKPAATNPAAEIVRNARNILEDSINGRQIIAEKTVRVQMEGVELDGVMFRSREPGKLDQGEIEVEVEEVPGIVVPYFHTKGPNPLSKKRPDDVLKGNNRRAKEEKKRLHSARNTVRQSAHRTAL